MMDVAEGHSVSQPVIHSLNPYSGQVHTRHKRRVSKNGTRSLNIMCVADSVLWSCLHFTSFPFVVQHPSVRRNWGLGGGGISR